MLKGCGPAIASAVMGGRGLGVDAVDAAAVMVHANQA